MNAEVEEIALALLWTAVGIVMGFTIYSYLSPRIQKQASPPNNKS